MRRTVAIIASLTILGLSVATFIAIRTTIRDCRPGDELSNEFYIAADLRERLEDRLEAASKLNPHEQAIVRRFLTKSLPKAGNFYEFDQGLSDNMTVLGVVGDAATISHLIAVIKANGAGSGKTNVVALRAIEAIEQRLASQQTKHTTPTSNR